ncbi:hypothetical protein QCA50_006158 [Cerrena zonata]|uniref:BHLH domain-containing protein n=1 Tax=Cerrena zonata TaxID=2478898 RepID=A0AAW0GIK7_9APHY
MAVDRAILCSKLTEVGISQALVFPRIGDFTLADSMSSSLLSPSESLAFNGFLSAVDVSDVLEWSTAHAQLAEQLQPPRGKEALAKATKDLMSLDAPDLNFSSGHHVGMGNEKQEGSSFMGSASSTTQRSMTNGSWPGFPSNPVHSSNPPTNQYSYGFGTPGSASWSQSQFPVPGQIPHSHSDPALRHHVHSQSPSSPSPFAPPDHSVQYGHRLPSIQHQSAPAGLSQQSVSTSKRSLDHSADPTSSKRRRSTVMEGDLDMRPPPIVTLPPASTSSTRSTSTSSSTSVTPTSEHPQQGGQAGLQPRQTLLSPSQKRANHIQSEQKRRANIRRGYEALCEAVPALREAIKAEECTGNIPDPSSSKSRTTNKKKKKGKATEVLEDDSKSGGLGLDGRAGPRSENVVLQKTIDHLNALLGERTELAQRLQYARSLLPSDHPALIIAPQQMDMERGVALWEREWNGGTGMGMGGDDDD